MSPRRFRILVCRGPECGDHLASDAIHAAFVEATRDRGLEGSVELAWQSCFGRCRQGPNVLVRAVVPGESPFLAAIAPMRPAPGAALYSRVAPTDAGRILDEHVVGGRVIDDLVGRLPGAMPLGDRPPGGSRGGDGK